jgi:CheY-like chemotaxis protein
LHGGSVAVDSELGKGSRFIVSLPWEHDGQELALSPAATTAVSESAQPSHGPTVLLVEDNESNIKTLMPYLQAKGYRVIIARDGSEAIQRCREERPKIILMDIQLPDMDGLAATRYIRKDIQFARVPIIALTALAMPGDRERCLEAGANEYLSKPVSLKGLTATMAAFLASGEAMVTYPQGQPEPKSMS